MFDTAQEGWENYNVKKVVAESYRIWISELAVWRVFLTLTFENETSYDNAMKKFKLLVKKLNRQMFGKNYSRIVGHSYFSYVLAIEKQGRGVIHFHVLIDRPVDFKLIHKWWGDNCGFAWAETTEDFQKVVKYVTKYICKGGEVIPFLTKKTKQPRLIPEWWNEIEGLRSD